MARLKQIGIDVDVNRALEQARLSFAESENDILRRLLLSPVRPARPAPARQAPPGPAGATRARGLWTVELGGQRFTAANLKHAYRTLLEQLAARYPDFLDRFALERGRSRRFVARDAARLYANAPHLAAKHGTPLGGGWFFDSNLSTAQVAKRARVAARLCGLHYGADARILDNLREI